MPQRTGSPKPPEVMTWMKASPVLAVGVIFDALRFFFDQFWFFGPAFAGLYCASWISDKVGSLGGVTTALCGLGATAVDFFAAAPIIAFGAVMAMAVGLFGWMTVGTFLLIKNPRIFQENAGNMAWFIGSLFLSEVPIVNAAPALTLNLFKMYHTQIKKEREAFKQYQKENQERLQFERQQKLQLLQMQQLQLQHMQIEQMELEDAANDELFEEGEMREVD